MNTFRLFSSFIILAILAMSYALPAQVNYPAPAFRVLEYDIHYRPDFEKEKLQASCEMLLQNQSDSAAGRIPLLLYRLLEVNSVAGEHERPLDFTQQVFSFEDWKQMQVNFIEVMPDEQIPAGDSIKITLEYEGYMAGYKETGMNYVRDKIDPEFTILRPDCYAYPVPGVPNEHVNRSMGLSQFDYTVKTTVPDSLMAVNGGQLEKIEKHDNKTTYVHTNIKPAWRIDVCIAEYEQLQDEVKLYYFPEDSSGARQLLASAKEAMALYTNWWGPLREQEQFNIIEIPDGYGSQADETAILQTASAFQDEGQMRQVYHELTHLWNVKPVGANTRWNEGLATFLEYLTMEELHDREILDRVTNWYLNHLKERLAADSSFATTTFSDYSQAGLTGYSYSLGMVYFRLLYELMGADSFNQLLARVHRDYQDGISDEAFMKLATKYGAPEELIRDWFYTTYYQQMIRQEWEFNDIVKHYS